MWYLEKVATSHANVILHIADDILAPIYGSQDKAYAEWFNPDSNKRAFVPVSEGVSGGLLSLKVSKDKSFLKISTLLVLEESKGKGCASAMLAHAIKFASNNGYLKIKVTVSETKPESVAFFQKNGFVIVDSVIGKYTDGVTEHTLVKG